MWYSYQQAVDLFGVDKANELFDKAWVPKGRKKLSDEEKKNKEYLKLSESAHGKLFHQWLDNEWLFHSHFWNEAGQAWSKNIIIMMAKKKAQGVKKGFPDYYVRVPIGNTNLYVNTFVELKKAPWVKWWNNGSIFKIDQAECLNNLDSCALTFVALCRWSEEAINWISDLKAKLENKTLQEAIEIWQDRDVYDYTDFVSE